MSVPWTRQGEGLLLRVHVQPGAKEDALAGFCRDALKIRLRARPVEGEANRRLLVFLAGLLDLPRHHITLLHGAHRRGKILRLEGHPLPALEQIFRNHLSEPHQ